MARPRKRFLPEDASYKLSGINTLDPPTLLRPEYSPNTVNMSFQDGIAEQRKGYDDLGNQIRDIVSEVLGHTIQALIRYESTGGTKYLIAVTTKHQFVYNTTTNSWEDITLRRASNAITVVHQGNRTFTVAGDQVSDYPVGSVCNVVGGANAGLFTIVSRAFDVVTTIVVNQAIPSGVVAGNIVADLEWTNTEANPVDWTIGVDTDLNRVVIITNNNEGDSVRYWDGAAQFKTLAIDLADFETCGTVEIFKDSLFLGNVLTTTREEAFYAYSAPGDFADFTSTGSGSGTISDSEGAILKLLNFGDRLSVWNEDSISVITFVGGDVFYTHETLIQNAGVLSAKSILNLGPFILYLHPESIQLFDGTRMLQTVADVIKSDIKALIDHNQRHLAYAFDDNIQKDAYFVIPLSATTQRCYVVDYDLFRPRNTRWSVFEWNDQVTSMGWFTRDETIKWSDLVGTTWAQIDFLWNHGAARTGSSVRVLGTSGGKVHLWDDTEISDNGVAIDAHWDSKDFIVPELYQSIRARWTEIEFEAKGTSVDVYTSISRGSNFVLAKTVTLKTGVDNYKVFINRSEKQMRVRFRNSSATGWFHLQWIRVWYKAGGVE